ncbi:MAG: T9SS type A sorting domain-containing protein [Bacteroidetes bacterium]|nr:T9SS type A sorting domain-containing protein [Bacteroidota bacterium]
MKSIAKIYLLFLLGFISFNSNLYAGSYTWTGATSTSWNTNSNWSPSGTPGTNDTVSISNQTNNPVLGANTTVKKFTINSGTLNLSTYSLTISTGLAKFSGGTISGSAALALKPRGSRATFEGTVFDVQVDAICSDIQLNGSTFNYKSVFEQTGTTSGVGQGNNVFNDTVTFINSGSGFFLLADTYGNTFNSTVYLNCNASKEIVASKMKSYFNGNIFVSSTVSGGGINFGAADGDTTFLASSKTLNIGLGGFSDGTLALRKFFKQSDDPISLTLSGNAVLNIQYSFFEGTVNGQASSVVVKHTIFNDSLTLTKTGNSASLSGGGNVFNGPSEFINTSTSQWRLANDVGDTFNGNVRFTTTSTGQIRPSYTGDTYFNSNILLTGSKISFVSGDGWSIFNGSSNQTINSNYPITLNKLKVNKASGYVSYDTTFTIVDTLQFIKGILTASDSNLLVIDSLGKVFGTSDSGYVEGSVSKIGRYGFEFPVGENGKYYPIYIDGQKSQNDNFICKYISEGQNIDTLIDSTLEYISSCRFWYLNRLAGNSKIKASFNWRWDDCELNNPIDLRVVKWDSLVWTSLDSINYSGDFSIANITPVDSINNFGYFTIGSVLKPYTWENYWMNDAVEAAPSTSSVCTNNSTAFSTKYNQNSWHIPDVTDPIKTVLVNLIIIQDANGLGNFDPWNSLNPQQAQVDRNRLNSIMGWVNTAFYSNHWVHNLNPPNVTPQFIDDTRIRFEVAGIYEYKDATMFLATNQSACVNWLNSIDPDKMNQMNIFFVGSNVGNLSGAAMFPSFTNMNYNTGIIIYNKYFGGNPVGDFSTAASLAHELGHNLGLYHSYGPTTCTESHKDYLWDLFGYSSVTPPLSSLCPFPTGASNDLMGSQQDCRYTSALQMGWMHRALALSSVRKYVKCDVNYGGEFEITTAEDWDFDIRVYKNIRIKSGGVMNLTCNLVMSENSKIFVEEGGKLNVDGGKISSVCNMWDGIEVWGDRYASQLPFISTTQGVVEFKNNAEVSDAHDVATTIKYDPNTGNWDWDKTGGIIRAENSSFFNNKRGFQFLSYHNFRPGFNQARNNLSYIHNCTFEVNRLLLNPYKNHYADITMYDVHGISIKGNTFRNTVSESVYYNQNYRGAGIISVDSRYSVVPLGSDRNSFENMYYGIYAANSNSLNPLIINNNDFIGCYNTIYASNISFLNISKNNIEVPARGPLGSAGTATWGLYLDNSPYYLVEDNIFESENVADADYGIQAVNSGNALNYIYNNVFDGFKEVAVYAIDDNDGPFINDGLLINCNDFDNQVLDEISVDLSPTGTSHGIGENQGTCGNTFMTSRNRFYSNVCGGMGLELKVKASPQPLSIINYASSNLNADAVLSCSTSTWVNNTLCTLDFDKDADCPPFAGNSTSQLRAILASYDEEIADYENELNSGLSSDLEYIIRSVELDSLTLADIINESPYISQNLLIAILDHIEEYAEAGLLNQIKTLFIQNCELTSGLYNYLAFCSNNSEYAGAIVDTVSYYMTGGNEAFEIITGLDNAISMREFYLSQYLNSCSSSDDTLYQAFFADTCISLLNNQSGYLLKHDSYLLNGDFTNAQLMLDSLDTLGLDEGFYSFIHTLDTINERSGTYLFGANQIIEALYTNKDNFTKTAAISRGLLTLLNDSIYEPPVLVEESEERIGNPYTFVEGESYMAYLFPNPTYNLLNVTVVSSKEISIRMFILDLNGRGVLNQALSNPLNIIDVSKLNPGVYIVNLTDENGKVKNEKFIKL